MNFVIKHIRDHAFKELIDRKNERVSEYARGRLLRYEDFWMQEHLLETDIDISLDGRKWIFKCWTNYIDIKANFQWKYENIWCICCEEDNPETNEHLIQCKVLLGSNEILSYIPENEELFSEDLSEVLYMLRIVKENLLFLFVLS